MMNYKSHARISMIDIEARNQPFSKLWRPKSSVMKSRFVAQTCSYCDGKGYIEIRDCSGEVQREETCRLCGGTGEKEDSHED